MLRQLWRMESRLIFLEVRQQLNASCCRKSFSKILMIFACQRLFLPPTKSSLTSGSRTQLRWLTSLISNHSLTFSTGIFILYLRMTLLRISGQSSSLCCILLKNMRRRLELAFLPSFWIQFLFLGNWKLDVYFFPFLLLFFTTGGGNSFKGLFCSILVRGISDDLFQQGDTCEFFDSWGLQGWGLGMASVLSFQSREIGVYWGQNQDLLKRSQCIWQRKGLQQLKLSVIGFMTCLELFIAKLNIIRPSFSFPHLKIKTILLTPNPLSSLFLPQIHPLALKIANVQSQGRVLNSLPRVIQKQKLLCSIFNPQLQLPVPLPILLRQSLLISFKTASRIKISFLYFSNQTFQIVKKNIDLQLPQVRFSRIWRL